MVILAHCGAGDVVCEIQTDKAVVALEVDDDGTLAKIVKVADSGTIKVGTLIAILAEDGEDWTDVQIPGTWPMSSLHNVNKQLSFSKNVNKQLLFFHNVNKELVFSKNVNKQLTALCM